MSQATPSADTGLTVALVHGAFADSSSWNGVIPLLQQAGVNVVAIPNELRSVSGDAAYVASAVNQIPGPVLLVGHSYGGAVITNAGSMTPNVVGLVYVSAFAPDEGESLASIETDSKDSVLVTALVPRQYPTGNGSETATEFLIDPAKVEEAFAGDLSQSEIALIGVTQRPISERAFTEETKSPAWKNLPSWAVVATGDKAAGTDVLRTMAERAGATVTEVDASHVVMISQPQAVTDVIMTAIAAVS
jgi:pimeloyl-ACP methyl ester carboxylesterase